MLIFFYLFFSACHSLALASFTLTNVYCVSVSREMVHGDYKYKQDSFFPPGACFFFSWAGAIK